LKRAPACGWGRWVLVFLLAGAPVLGSRCVQAQSRDERAVRAAYVFNLIRYVEWPSPDGELTIAFVGDPATGEVMKKMLSGKTSDARTIRVVLSPSEEELQKCNVLYVAELQAGDFRKALDKVRDRNILTVGETDSFVRGGGMIGLVNTGDHIQIEANPEAAQRVGVRISSRVLNLALIVHSAQKGAS
jgi:hypothetical protein